MDLNGIVPIKMHDCSCMRHEFETLCTYWNNLKCSFGSIKFSDEQDRRRPVPNHYRPSNQLESYWEVVSELEGWP